MTFAIPPIPRWFATYLFACLASLLLAVFSVLPADAQEQPNLLRIQSVVYNAGNHSVGLVAPEGAQYSGEYQMVRLSQPDRLVIDVPNALLSTPTRTLPIHQQGIDHIELSQSLGTFYQVVRVTVVATQPDALSNVTVQPKNNILVISLPSTANTVATQPPLPPPSATNQGPLEKISTANKTIIQSVSAEDGSFRLIAQDGQPIIIKNQFTLNSPNRLVVDFANCVLGDKRLLAPIDIRQGAIQSVRLGQFDESTVRMVIETPRPNGLYLVYPSDDRSLIALTSNLAQSIRTLPLENQTVGFIQDIHLNKREDGSLIRISTSNPMVRRLIRQKNEIVVDLINIAARPSVVAYDKNVFSEIKEIRLTPLSAKEPNTKLIIKLNQSDLLMDSHLSLDGRTLDLTLTQKHSVDSSRRMPTLLLGDEGSSGGLPFVKRGAYTVVVDAGHGGKDLGANRVGVYEKDLNLSVALKLKRALEAKGVTVYLTRSTDTFLELSQITGITNRIRPDAFVSVHTNASVNSSAQGLETYYFTPQSRELAQKVHRRMVNHISSPDRGVRTARFYVVHHTSVPAILCEMGYISNPGERAELQSDARQQATAEAIAQGVVEFLGRRIQAEASQGEQP